MPVGDNPSRGAPCTAPETPILDQLQEIPISAVLRDGSQLVVLIRMCISVSSFLAVFALNCYRGGSGVVATICALFVARYFCIGVHELGHLLAGIFLGRSCQLFAIGPACLFRQGSRWRFQFARSPSRFAGRTNMPPSRPGSSVAKEFIFVVAGRGANAFLVRRLSGSAASPPGWFTVPALARRDSFVRHDD